MKKLLLLALCLILSANADARTLYVDARRPNNNGNGYSLKKAKKTIQAAINVAKNGDTILVYPGCYRGIATNNKKIKIKSKSGAARTEIVPMNSDDPLKLGKKSSGKGTNTTLSGFRVPGPCTSLDTFWENNDIHGGTMKSCILYGRVSRSKLIGCTLYLTKNGSIYDSLNRCKIVDGRGDFSESKFANCLFANNKTIKLSYSTLANCTIADNDDVDLVFVKAYNTILHKVPACAFRKSKQNKLKNCYQGPNPKFVSTTSTKKSWVEESSCYRHVYYPSRYYEQRIVGADVYWENLVGAELWWKYIGGAEVYWEDSHDWSNHGYVTVLGTTDTEILAAAKAQVGLPDAYYSINVYNYDEGSDSVSCTTHAAVFAVVKARVPVGADLDIDYNYDNGHVSVPGTTDAEILAAAKKKTGKPNATYSIERYEYEYGWYKTDTIPSAYRLKKDSPCIDKGTKAAAAKKLYGTKDLAGKKRVKGKSVDIGCYEY